MRKFIEGLSFDFNSQVMTYAFVNNMGNLYFISKAQDDPEEVDSDTQKQISAVKYVLDHLPFFST